MPQLQLANLAQTAIHRAAANPNHSAAAGETGCARRRSSAKSTIASAPSTGTGRRHAPRARRRHYHRQLQRLYRFLVPPGPARARSGLRPGRPAGRGRAGAGVGIDLSAPMVRAAARLHPDPRIPSGGCPRLRSGRNVRRHHPLRSDQRPVGRADRLRAHPRPCDAAHADHPQLLQPSLAADPRPGAAAAAWRSPRCRRIG